MFLKKVQTIAGSGYNDTFITHGYKVEPKTPEQLGLPALSVKSEGNVVYKPQFGIDGRDTLVIQFGHYYGGGTYGFDTLLGRGKWSSGTGGLDLYGGDKSPNNLISEQEMSKLLDWMKKNEKAILDAFDVEPILARSEITSKKLPTKGTPEYHQHKIAVDIVKNPMKTLLHTKPYSVEDAKKMLKQNYGYSEKDLKDLEVQAAAEGYNFETPEEQIAELTRFYNDNGKWQEEYFENPDYAEAYDHIITEVNPETLDRHGSMGEDFEKIWKEIPKANHKDAWQWVKENTKAEFTYWGSPGHAEPNSAFTLMQGGEEEVQVSGLTGVVNGTETNDVLKWLTEGLTPEQIKKAQQACSDYVIHGDLLYVNTGYSLINFPVDLNDFRTWIQETLGIKVEGMAAAADDHEMLIQLAKVCQSCNKIWGDDEHLDWQMAEDLVKLMKSIKKYPPHTKQVAHDIFRYSAQEDWDSGVVANWPTEILDALKLDGITVEAKFVEAKSAKHDIGATLEEKDFSMPDKVRELLGLDRDVGHGFPKLEINVTVSGDCTPGSKGGFDEEAPEGALCEDVTVMTTENPIDLTQYVKEEVLEKLGEAILEDLG